MSDDVKGGAARSYDATGRREKARARRAAVLVAARELLEERGFAATTMADVARRAEVSPESIYKGFGTKAALVKQVFDVTIAGDDEPVAVADRPESRRIQDEPDVAVKLRLYAEGVGVRAERSARVQLAIRDGAAVDPAVDELWQRLQAERLTGMTMLARHLVESGGIRSDGGVDRVRDVLWSCIAVEVYDLFVLQRGWTREDYVDWLATTLVASLVDGGPSR